MGTVCAFQQNIKIKQWKRQKMLLKLFTTEELIKRTAFNVKYTNTQIC